MSSGVFIAMFCKEKLIIDDEIRHMINKQVYYEVRIKINVTLT